MSQFVWILRKDEDQNTGNFNLGFENSQMSFVVVW